jgi:hypothetical protein
VGGRGHGRQNIGPNTSENNAKLRIAGRPLASGFLVASPRADASLTGLMQRASSRATGFAVRAHKTAAASAAAIVAAWTDGRRRAHWLSGVKLRVRSAGPRSIRLVCEDDGTEITVRIAAKSRGRCAITVDHTNLASAQMVTERRHCWKEMLRNLAQFLERRAGVILRPRTPPAAARSRASPSARPTRGAGRR